MSSGNFAANYDAIEGTGQAIDENDGNVYSLSTSHQMTIGCTYEADTYPGCDGVTWGEFQPYLESWGAGDTAYGHVIIWSELKCNLGAWALGDSSLCS